MAIYRPRWCYIIVVVYVCVITTFKRLGVHRVWFLILLMVSWTGIVLVLLVVVVYGRILFLRWTSTNTFRYPVFGSHPTCVFSQFLFVFAIFLQILREAPLVAVAERGRTEAFQDSRLWCRQNRALSIDGVGIVSLLHLLVVLYHSFVLKYFLFSHTYID